MKTRAMEDGFMTLRRSGIQKILQGATTIEEVRAATLADGT